MKAKKVFGRSDVDFGKKRGGRAWGDGGGVERA